MSMKLFNWQEFSNVIETHIENYVLPQYGDTHEDQAAVYSIEDCVRQMSKYLARFGKNVREDQQELDFIKIAHYAQIAYTKLGDLNAKK